MIALPSVQHASRLPPNHPCLQGALRKAQNRCKALEGELASSKAPQSPQQAQPPSSEAQQQQDPAAAELQAECASLASQLEEAQRLQQEAEALAAERLEQCTRLEQQVAQLQQQAAALAAGVAPPDTAGAAAVGSPADKQAVSSGDVAASPTGANLQQQLAEKAAQLEQVEFERDELAVRLEDSEKRVVALCAEAAAVKQQQQQQADTGEAADKTATGRNESDGSEHGWRLAAGVDASGSQAAHDAVAAARQEADALQQRVQQLESQVVALHAELAAAQTGAGGAAVPDVAAADLRRQLQERTQEVADLSALSIKADATVQQYMAQLRRWVLGWCRIPGLAVGF